MSDKGKDNKTTQESPKAGKYGLRPYGTCEQADPTPAVMKSGDSLTALRRLEREALGSGFT